MSAASRYLAARGLAGLHRLEVLIPKDFDAKAKKIGQRGGELGADRRYEVLADPIGQSCEKLLLSLGVERVPESVLVIGLRRKDIDNGGEQARGQFYPLCDASRVNEVVFVHRTFLHGESPCSSTETA